MPAARASATTSAVTTAPIIRRRIYRTSSIEMNRRRGRRGFALPRGTVTAPVLPV